MSTKTQTLNGPQDKLSDKANFGSKTSKSGKESLKKIFEELLQDTYNAEKQLLKALPEAAKAAYNEYLQDAFEHHFEQTKRQVERLEKVFDRLRIEKGNETCEAMEGLVKEVKEIIDEHDKSIIRDVALIIASQKVEHYEIAAYGSLVELADVLGLNNTADLFERTLREEKETDQRLSEIAQYVNDEAYEECAAELEYKS
ncbi:MAG TPA: ferritin-like domain-containing protein [Bacteroidia bacterium]|jgi:ferritin-like metal-binding protein YciE|nr:ferritin-like domain-containing protein [Bacteroidia bacterium]